MSNQDYRLRQLPSNQSCIVAHHNHNFCSWTFNISAPQNWNTSAPSYNCHSFYVFKHHHQTQTISIVIFYPPHKCIPILMVSHAPTCPYQQKALKARLRSETTYIKFTQDDSLSCFSPKVQVKTHQCWSPYSAACSALGGNTEREICDRSLFGTSS